MTDAGDFTRLKHLAIIVWSVLVGWGAAYVPLLQFGKWPALFVYAAFAGFAYYFLKTRLSKNKVPEEVPA